MIKAIVLAAVYCLISSVAFSQFFENFTDGDFTANPSWSGNMADWTVNPSLQLQSNNTVANSTYFLSTPSTLAVNTQWEMYIALTFNPSSANYIDVFITASQSDISDNNTSGYFVRIGNTDDEVSLYRKDAGGTSTRIIDGVNGILNTSSNTLKIKVIRAAGNQFTLYRDITGTGNNYVLEGTALDATFSSSSFFGFLVRQITASFFQRHFFDDIEVKPYVPDVIPPLIQSATALSPNTLDVLFNEPVDQVTAQALNNYSVNNAVGNPSQAIRDAVNSALVHLVFGGSFSNGVNHILTVSGVKDFAGNIVSNAAASFSFYTLQRYDVVIDEILADPSPPVGLPNAEFIELRNMSGRSINLQGWKITSSSTASNVMPNYILPADSFVIITGSSSSALFNPFGRTLGVAGFPALDNDGTTLSLISKENVTIHAVSYSSSWYQNAVKSEGGWTLEMIDAKNPCSGATNWKASIDLRGGTPGTKNAVDGINKDQVAPALLRAYATDSVTIVLNFDEPLDSAKAALVVNYTISDGIGTPVSAITLGPVFTSVQLKLGQPIVKTKVYQVTASNLTDCSGNTIQAIRTTRLGLSSVIDTFDIVINEILFNPKPNGVDYLELYNRSNKIFDLKDVYIANRSSSNNVANVRQVSPENIPLFPGDYFVISEDEHTVKQQYVAMNPANFINLSGMPSYADDKGAAVLLNAQGKIIDELQYDARWHFSLIDNNEGISLERIDYNKPTQNKDNWFSAASTAGYGTPSYQNSQFRNDLQLKGEVTVVPKTFSPDNDGYDDFAIIGINMSEPGYIANITIFDAAGRPVKALTKNAILGLSGTFRWDGMDDKSKKVSIGTYIVYTEVFNLNGRKKTFKNAVVVAARF